jgi:hypothetical protein
MQQPPKKLLTPKRVNEVADSLDKTSFNYRLRATKEKEESGIENYTSKYLTEKANADKLNSIKYRRLALKAMKK